MRVPKEIADEVAKYQEAKEKMDAAWKKVTKWLNENTGADGVEIEDVYITDKPDGIKQSADGEFCDQHPYGGCEDSFYGDYYHKIEDSDKYVGYHFIC